MGFKRLSFMAVLCLLIGVAIFATKTTNNSDRVECVVRSNQVVLNQYSKKVLRRSQSFAGHKVTTWNKGDLKPYVREYAAMYVYDDGPPNNRDEQSITIYSSASDVIFYGVVPVNCAKTLQDITVTGRSSK